MRCLIFGHNWFKSSWKTLTPRDTSGEPTGPHDFFSTGLVCHSCGRRRAGRVRLVASQTREVEG